MNDFTLDALDSSVAYLISETRRAGHSRLAEGLEAVRQLIAEERAAAGSGDTAGDRRQT